MGGALSIGKKKVVLTHQSKKDIAFIFSVFHKYPFLTSRKICQYNFALKCMIGQTDKSEFITKRDDKYFNQLSIYKSLILKYTNALPIYFPCWLSGFIEAEGHFRLSRSPKGGIKSYQFKIGQNYDYFTLEMIKVYFNSTHKISKANNPNKDHFKIAIGGPVSRAAIYKHFETYPLLGQKFITYHPWVLARETVKGTLKLIPSSNVG